MLEVRGPHEVPDLRLHLLHQWQPGRPLHAVYLKVYERWGDEVNRTDIQFASDTLRYGHLYWVAPEFCDLLFHAARQVPPDMTMAEIVPPPPNDWVRGFAWPGALVVLGKPWSSPDCRVGGVEVPTHAFTFRAGFLGADHEEVMATAFYGWSGVWGHTGANVWRMTDPIRVVEESQHVADVQVDIVHDRQLLIAFCVLANDRLLADVAEEPPPRHVARRSQRAGLPSTVRVTYLRQSERPAGHGSEAGPVAWSHRWLVSGHWKRQVCGPGLKERKLIWVRPHVKGPGDKPLVVKETVRALVR